MLAPVGEKHIKVLCPKLKIVYEKEKKTNRYVLFKKRNTVLCWSMTNIRKDGHIFQEFFFMFLRPNLVDLFHLQRSVCYLYILSNREF